MPHPGPQLDVEIITPAPTEFFACRSCEMVLNTLDRPLRRHEDRDESLPPEMRAQYEAIAAWVTEASGRYGDRLRVRIVDAVSIEGLVRALRHGLRRFPVIVIDGKERIKGDFDREALDRVLERHFTSRR